MAIDPKYYLGQKVWWVSWYFDPSFHSGEITNAQIVDPLSLYPTIEYRLNNDRHNWYPERILFTSLESAQEYAKNNPI